MNKEIFVKENEFLISKTDLKGTITYCNKSFLEIVGAKEEELIGKPHNIIRHEDMPKIVFKILWDYIQSKKEIFAYVKNKSFNGSFYWVFANVTASIDENSNIIGYYSVRRKPNPQAIKTITAVYQMLKEEETKGGIQASSNALNNFLNEKNISYSEFINKIQRL